jgi:hypothetical protein
MRRAAILAVIVASLLLGTVAPTLSHEHDPLDWYTVEQGAASGGGYRLTSLAWQVSGTASGGGYRLLGPAGPASSENGCCCTYLPCVLRGQ